MGRGKSKKKRSKRGVAPVRNAEAQQPIADGEERTGEVDGKSIEERRVEPVSGGKLGLGIWVVCLGVVAIGYLVLKMFAMHPYAGDEHIYLYQAKLISEGVAPYSGFSMAHPPMHALFTAIVFKLFGYSFLLGRFLPVFWCLLGGLALAGLVYRELGGVASIASAALYLLAYEPLRASSHYTGVNMTVALLIASVLAYRLGAIRATAALCAIAVFTRLYAAPGVIVIVVFALISNPREGLRLIAWGAGIGVVGFIAFGLWAGFGDMFHNMLLYHAQKTPMKPGQVAGMRDKILFHNASISALFVLSQLAVIASIVSAYLSADSKLRVVARLRGAVGSSEVGLVILASGIAFFFLSVLLNMNRVWMYYFIPSFPFAAVAGGWLVKRWVGGAISIARERPRLRGVTSQRKFMLAGGVALFVVFVVCCLMSPRLESNLSYYKHAMEKMPEGRSKTYTWQPSLLPDAVDELVRSTLWKDVRVIGEEYTRFNFYLWHESRVLNIVDEVVATIQKETSQQSEIFGDSGTAPLFALLTGRRIAANEVDTNLQRYRSGNADPVELVKNIDQSKTEMIILRHMFGVAGVREVRQLVKKKYRLAKQLRTSQNRVFYLYKRRDDVS